MSPVLLFARLDLGEENKETGTRLQDRNKGGKPCLPQHFFLERLREDGPDLSWWGLYPKT